ncbi:MAG TPA: hypothetical protein VHG91_04035 [Longimicrobium sp.]|nr:hypothetical protein [Longimicrobium sp.]
MAKTRGDTGQVTVRFTATSEERERTTRARLERGGPAAATAARVFPVLMLAFAAALLALVGYASARGVIPARLAAGMAGFTLLLAAPAVVFAVPALRRRVLFRETGEETLTVGRDGVAWTPAAGVPVELPWAEVESVEEHLGVLLFVPRRGVAVAVPRRALDGARGYDRVREAARRHLGPRARFE